MSYLGAAYGAIGSSAKTAYVVVQDNNSYLLLVPIGGSPPLDLTGQIPTMFNTPIACVFLGNRLIVYYFNPGGPRGAPLMRTVVTSTEKVDTKDLPAATAPNGYTQLSAFINPNSINPTGISGDVIITYVESGSNQIIQYTDSLDFS